MNAEPVTKAGRALDRYVFHEPTCSKQPTNPDRRCTCGWTDRILAIEAQARAAAYDEAHAFGYREGYREAQAFILSDVEGLAHSHGDHLCVSLGSLEAWRQERQR